MMSVVVVLFADPFVVVVIVVVVIDVVVLAVAAVFAIFIAAGAVFVRVCSGFECVRQCLRLATCNVPARPLSSPEETMRQ